MITTIVADRIKTTLYFRDGSSLIIPNSGAEAGMGNPPLPPLGCITTLLTSPRNFRSADAPAAGNKNELSPPRNPVLPLFLRALLARNRRSIK